MTHRSSADTHQPGQLATAKEHTDAQVSPQSSWGSSARTDRTPDLANSYLAGHHDYVIAQTYAFGVLIVVLSLITAAAMLATKHPAHMERAACWIVGILIDWRSWALLTVGLVVVAVTCTLLQPQR